MLVLSLKLNKKNQITKHYKDSDYAKAEKRGKEWEKEDPKYNTYYIHELPDWKPQGKRERCVNCHFLAVRLEKTNMNEALVHPALRQSLMKKDYEWINRGAEESLCCYHKVWDEDTLLFFESFDLEYELLEKDRKNFCYYRDYQTGMSFEAASVLEKREYNLRQTEVDRKNTRRALYVTVTALVINVVLSTKIVEKVLEMLKTFLSF